jgi:hypothetical protein
MEHPNQNKKEYRKGRVDSKEGNLQPRNTVSQMDCQRMTTIVRGDRNKI